MLYAVYNPQATKPQATKPQATEQRTTEPQITEQRTLERKKEMFPFEPFQFTIERMRHVQGEWRSLTATLFPEYVFFECENERADEVRARLEGALNRDRTVKQQVPLISVPGELSDLLYDLCDERHHISMSKGIIINGLAHVTEGPLIGHDHRIVRIDRHKRLAWLKFSDRAPRDFAKNSTSVLVAGLEITEKYG
ncbi:MAG: hypothetical protein LUD16_10130 [Lachnospiraceae bacterium]|nr:hypothetical protein [Lachnospiraceae bacterium]